LGNGGMNTTYPAVANPACGGGSGVFCGGKAGVDLIQAFIAVGYAHKIGALSLGVSPIFALQRFKSSGLVAFSGVSSDPANLTGRGYDFSYGGGARVGAEYEIMPNLRLGASFQTKMYMSKFDKYAGLFEDGGDFDIPANFTVGIAADVTPDFTFMFDYKRIFYSDIDSIGNPSTIPLPLGSSGGPGFGWHDVDIFKVGAEWRMDEKWTLRAGYAYNDNPITSSDVTLNILAPGVVQHHITGGFAYNFNDYHTVEFAAMFAPNTKVSGIEVTPFGPNPARTIELEMHQFALTLGWNYNFGSAQ
ncbi:MAG: OmpP1/FadL family transporter, partial [Aestuariivirgaceae bacterium]